MRKTPKDGALREHGAMHRSSYASLYPTYRRGLKNCLSMSAAALRLLSATGFFC